MDLNDISGIASLVDKFPSLKPVVNSVGFTKTEYKPEELPSQMTASLVGGEPATYEKPFYGLPASTIPDDLPAGIQAYRADPTGKYGGKNGLETQPLQRFNEGGNRLFGQEKNTDSQTSTSYSDPSKAVQELYRYARTNGAMGAAGYPALTADQMAAFALKEGRSDYGANGSYGSKLWEKTRKELSDKYLLSSTDKAFIATVADKQRVADKLGIPFAEAWNGTGSNGKATGKEYAADWEHHRQAALKPENQQLMDLINRGIADGQKFGFPLKKDIEKYQTRQAKQVPYKTGGAVSKPLQGNNKLI
jgi:hypothetical protein